MTGTVLAGKYQILRPLGSGGMGTVYEARHLGTGRLVAVKLLSRQQTNHVDLTRFEREARALGELSHPNIVDVLDFGFDAGNGAPYLVMELLAGEPLDRVILPVQGAKHRALEEVAGLLEPVARALDFAHARGFVHRDVKPSNVFLARTGDGSNVVKLLDFGLARGREFAKEEGENGEICSNARKAPGDCGSTDLRLTEDGMVVGTPHYIAPEVALGERAGPAADRFALAVVAFELLTGSPPFPGRGFSEIAEAAALEKRRSLAPLRPDLPAELEGTFARALASSPQLRPATALAFVEELRRIAEIAKERSEASRRALDDRDRKARNLLIAFPAALALAAAFWVVPALPPIQQIEGRSTDLRLGLEPERARTLDLVFVIVDEATLASDPTPLASRADEFARTLDTLFHAGARGVAVDFLLPSSWSESPAFSHAVRTYADRLVLAAFARSDGSVTGHEAVSGLTAAALGPQAAAEPFGLVNLEEDVDGYVRRARPAFLDESPIPRDAFAARIARLASRPGPAVRSRSTAPLLIDGRIRWQDAPVVSWKDLTSFLGQGTSALTGRIAVIGGNFEGSGDDYLRLPSASGKRVSGVFIQGLVAESFAASDPLSELSATTRSVLLAGAALMAYAVTLLFSSRVALIVLSVAAVLHTAVAFGFISTLGIVLPWPSVLLAVLAGATLAAVIRRLTPQAAVPAREPG